MNNLRDAAKKYAERGVPVFPTKPGSKEPACLHGFHDATVDLGQIDAWWSENPDYNIAFSPHDIGLSVVDLDGPEGESAWLEAQLVHEFAPDTWEVRTPRGRHLYFKGELPPTQAIIGKHIDTRGRGSYALLAPSVIDGRNGKGPETWGTYVTGGGALAAVPDWIMPVISASRKEKAIAAVDELDMPGNIDRARTQLMAYVATGNTASEGEMGDKLTYVIACEMLSLGLSPDKAQEVIEEIWNPACQPPWASDELRVKIDNAARYAQNEAGSWATEPEEKVFGAAVDAYLATLPPARPSRFRPLSEDEQDHLPEPTWLLPDLLPDDSTVMLYGPSGSYKSFLALDIALTLASGIAGFGACERPACDVVYVSGEGSRSIARKRRPAWRAARGVEGGIKFHLVPDMPWIADPTMMAEMIREIQALKVCPRLIVLDTLARAMTGMDESFAKDAGATIAAVEFLKRTFGCSVMVVHHTGKDESRGARGSSALLAGFDATYEVKRLKGRAVEVWNRKQKDAEERATPWTFEGKEVGPSLVFFATDPSRHDELSGKANVSPKGVARALGELGAVDAEHCVSSHVLASVLIPEKQDDAPEARAETLDALAKELVAQSRGRLAVFATGRGPGLRWSTISAPAPSPAGP